MLLLLNGKYEMDCLFKQHKNIVQAIENHRLTNGKIAIGRFIKFFLIFENLRKNILIIFVDNITLINDSYA